MKTFIDLFAGIGGFRLALEKHGLKCVFSSEIDQHARSCYKDNFGVEPKGDITKINAKDIPDHDVLCAGFPCQSFSIAGKRQGLSDIKRGQLFKEVVRVASSHRPKLLLLENVPHILTMFNGEIIKTIIEELKKAGYHTHIHTLNSADYGIPQSRKRVYFVCMREEFLAREIPGEPWRVLEDVLDDDSYVDENLYIKRDDIVIVGSDRYNNRPIQIGYVGQHRKPVGRTLLKEHRRLQQRIFTSGAPTPTIMPKHRDYYHVAQGARIYSSDRPALAINSSGGNLGAQSGLYNIKDKIRRLTINECRKLMGFPDDFKLPERYSVALRLLGNAVIPKMIDLVYTHYSAKT